MSDWTAHYATAAGYRWWPHTELVAALAGRHVSRALELGCGNGSNLWLLAEHAEHVTGIDFDDQALLAAAAYLAHRRVDPTRVQLLPGDITAGLPFAEDSFAVVVDCVTSQHLPWAAHAALYREAARVLAPGGVLWIAHLDAMTESARGPALGGWDYGGLALFPTVPRVCLPPCGALARVVRDAGFRAPVCRGLVREYPDGQRASYTILSAEVA